MHLFDAYQLDHLFKVITFYDYTALLALTLFSYLVSSMTFSTMANTGSIAVIPDNKGYNAANENTAIQVVSKGAIRTDKHIPTPAIILITRSVELKFSFNSIFMVHLLMIKGATVGDITSAVPFFSGGLSP